MHILLIIIVSNVILLFLRTFPQKTQWQLIKLLPSTPWQAVLEIHSAYQATCH